MEVGAARSDITPPLGSPIAGYMKARYAESVHDNLYAKAIVFNDGKTEAAIVACDLIALGSEHVREARSLIEREAGIPAGNVMICCTHTHTGPATVSVFLVDRDEDYLATLPAKIASAVAEAKARSSPCDLRIARTEVRGIAFNRRYRMKDGTIRTNPGRGNPDILGPAGPVDPDLGVLVAEGDGVIRALLVNYANHLDTVGVMLESLEALGGNLISADYPAFMESFIRSELGDEVEVIFANGACGDINHIDVNVPTPLKAGFEEAEKIGRALADGVIKAIKAKRPLGGAGISVLRKEIVVPLRTVSQDMLKWAESVLEAEGEDPGRDGIYARELKILSEENLSEVGAEIQVIRIGDFALVGVPGELFVELGLAIKGRSPLKHTFVAELANGYIGYIPTEEAFSQQGYEERLARSSRVAPGAGEMIVDQALELLDRASSSG